MTRILVFTFVCLLVAPAFAATTIVFIGDSLTEGYGVKQDQAFPAVAQAKLKSDGRDVHVINGGIGGSVSADADRRVTWFLKSKPSILVFELGGNDALKGTPVDVIEKNLDKALTAADGAGLKTLVLGMKVFTNFGPDYARSFEQMYSRLAKKHHAQLMPFLLEGVALNKSLMQADRIHPNAEGHAVVGKNVAAALEKLL